MTCRSAVLARTCFLVFLAHVTHACSFARTQTIVEIRADQTIQTQVTELRVEAHNPTNAVLFSRTFNPRAADFPGFPLELPISTRDAARNFVVQVTATRSRVDGTTTIVETLASNRLQTSFVQGQVSRVVLWLLAQCPCPESERCVPDRNQDGIPECDPLWVDPRPTLDAGVDATSDVGTSDAPSCSATQRTCGGRCVERDSALACGASCEVCPAFSGGTPICTSDQCDVTCGSSTPDRCSTACANLNGDRQNCGICGHMCDGNQLCLNRNCVAPPPCTPGDTTCSGLTFCNPLTNHCEQGCDGRADQCAVDRSCDLVSHTCACRGDLRACGNVCATCPTGAQVVATGCASNACVVTMCSAGYEPSVGGATCQDIDECAVSRGGCDVHATCTNTPGNRACVCNTGYTGSGTVCTPTTFDAAVDSRLDSGGDADIVGPLGGCPDDTVASTAVGARVFAGSTIRRGDDLVPTCGRVGAPDVVHRWRAPAAGWYIFDTTGSNFDTVLELRRGLNCVRSTDAGMTADAGTQSLVLCNDDTGGGAGPSALMTYASAGEDFLVVIDGFVGSSGEPNAGTYELNVLPFDPAAALSLSSMQSYRAMVYGRICDECSTVAGFANVPTCQRSQLLGPEYLACETSTSSAWPVRESQACEQLALTRLNTCFTNSTCSANGNYRACRDQYQAVISACARAFPKPSEYTSTLATCRRGCPTLNATGVSVTGTLPSALNSDDRLVSTCSGSGPEAWVQWTPPSAGRWIVSATSSSFDPTLSQWNSCSSSTYVCGTADLSATDNTSRLAITVPTGTPFNPMVVLVDSESADSAGDYQLSFVQVLCPDVVASMTGPTVHQGMLGSISNFVACNAGAGPESVVQWTPTAAGRYLVQVHSNAFDPTLGLMDCATLSPTSQCSTDVSASNLDATLVVTASSTLAPMNFIVDSVAAGAAGAFTLTITDTIPCEIEPLTSSTLTGNMTGRFDSFDQCRGTGADRIFSWTASQTANVTIDTNGSGFDTVLAVYTGTCMTNTQIGCDDDSGDGNASLLTFAATAGQTYLFVVSAYSSTTPTQSFTLNVH